MKVLAKLMAAQTGMKCSSLDVAVRTVRCLSVAFVKGIVVT